MIYRNLSVQEERVNAMQAEEERQARWQAATTIDGDDDGGGGGGGDGDGGDGSGGGDDSGAVVWICESVKEKGVGQKLNVNQTCGWKGEGKDSRGFCWRTRLVSGTYIHNLEYL